MLAALTGVLLFTMTGVAGAHTGGGKAAGMAWKESGSAYGFGATVTVHNFTDRIRRVRVIVQVEGSWSLETTTPCNFYPGCVDYNYQNGTVTKQVSTTLRIGPYGKAGRRLSGSWGIPAGATLDYVYADMIHLHRIG